jgi:hypothetical protein
MNAADVLSRESDLGTAASALFIMHSSPIIVAQNQSPLYGRFSQFPELSLDGSGGGPVLSSAAGTLCSLLTSSSAEIRSVGMGRARSKSLVMPSETFQIPQTRKRSESLSLGGPPRRRARTMSDITPIDFLHAERVGMYSPERRRHVVERFLEKRRRRIWRKRVKYDVRKNFADSRLRVKGRFVRKEDEDVLRDLMSML